MITAGVTSDNRLGVMTTLSADCIEGNRPRQQVHSPHMAWDNLLCSGPMGSIIQRCAHGAQTNHTMEAAWLLLLYPNKNKSYTVNKLHAPTIQFTLVETRSYHTWYCIKYANDRCNTGIGFFKGTYSLAAKWQSLSANWLAYWSGFHVLNGTILMTLY